MGSVPAPSIPPSFLVIGAGSRGNAYARAVTASTSATIGAVADIDTFKRREFGRKYIWSNAKPAAHQEFNGWEEWIAWEIKRRKTANATPSSEADDYIPITGVFICTLDETHASIIQALAPLSLHILCEKPLALSLKDCLSIQYSLAQYPPKIVSIGHVLRYSPHNILLRKLLVEDQTVGEVVSIEHTEPVGYWHFAHSYVRGNWRRSHEEGVGSLLTKSCHDIDFLMWLLCSPSRLTGDTPHEPSTVTSTGKLTHFRKARKPKKAGAATNCLQCTVQDECIYSATKIYRDRWCKNEKDAGWPLKIVVPEIEDIVTSSGWDAAETRLMDTLAEDYNATSAPDSEIARRAWYGRCVYESDNNVCDDQTVIISWDEDPLPQPLPHSQTNPPSSSSEEPSSYGRGPKTALFHMTYPTAAQCVRRGRIYGSLGEISYDSRTITVHSFTSGESTEYTIPKQPPEVEKSHGGGDWGLAGKFVDAVSAVEGGAMGVHEAQEAFVGAGVEEIVRSHGVVFAAEAARVEGRVVRWEEWWGQQRRRFAVT